MSTDQVEKLAAEITDACHEFVAFRPEFLMPLEALARQLGARLVREVSFSPSSLGEPNLAISRPNGRSKISASAIRLNQDALAIPLSTSSRGRSLLVRRPLD
jgi:hypothetical protein